MRRDGDVEMKVEGRRYLLVEEQERSIMKRREREVEEGEGKGLEKVSDWFDDRIETLPHQKKKPLPMYGYEVPT
jgi:hypothetical protein